MNLQYCTYTHMGRGERGPCHDSDIILYCFWGSIFTPGHCELTVAAFFQHGSRCVQYGPNVGLALEGHGHSNTASLLPDFKPL